MKKKSKQDDAIISTCAWSSSAHDSSESNVDFPRVLSDATNTNDPGTFSITDVNNSMLSVESPQQACSKSGLNEELM